jgi:uncharacterized integral membrane protein
MESMPFTVGVVANVFIPEPESVRLSYVTTAHVWSAPLKITVLEFAVKVPLFVQLPLTVKVFEPVIVSVAPE